MSFIDDFLDKCYTRFLSDKIDPETNLPVLDGTGRIEKELDFNKLKGGLTDWKDNKFGLFTPYESAKDAGISWAVPFLAPIALGIIASLAATVATLAATIALGCLIVSGGAALFKNEELKQSAFDFALIAGIIAGIAAAVNIVGALLAFVVAPVALVSALTRTGSTILSPCVRCDDAEEQTRMSVSI